jgi:hypothetical protein
VIGKTIRLTDYPFRIVGVMPPGFEHVSGGYRLLHDESVGVWLPFDLLGNRGVLGPFTTAIQSRASSQEATSSGAGRMNVIAKGLETEYFEDRNWRIQVK